LNFHLLSNVRSKPFSFFVSDDEAQEWIRYICYPGRVQYMDLFGILGQV
jgi:hypothetical protein